MYEQDEQKLNPKVENIWDVIAGAKDNMYLIPFKLIQTWFRHLRNEVFYVSDKFYISDKEVYAFRCYDFSSAGQHDSHRLRRRGKCEKGYGTE